MYFVCTSCWLSQCASRLKYLYSIAGVIESEFSLQKSFCELLQKWHALRAEGDQRSHGEIYKPDSRLLL